MIRKGTRVKMSHALKKQLRKGGSAKHVQEFGNCIGVVQGKTLYKNRQTFEEVDVRWQPSNLRYSYFPKHLVRVEKMK